jgi:hypothetical protein
LIFIIRKTYGWNKKSDWISLSQFHERTNIPIPHICRALQLLQKQNIITKGGNRVNPKYSVQKDYDSWLELPKGVRSHHSKLPKGVINEAKDTKNIQKGVIEITKGGNRNYQRGQIQKTILQNTLLQKKRGKGKFSDDITKTMNIVLEKFRAEIGTKMKGFPKESVNNLEYWLTIYDLEDILRAIENIKKDEFWKDKMSLVILFRQKNPKGEPVDWIGDMLRKGDSSRKDALLLSKDHILATAQLLQINYGAPIQVYDDKGKTIFDAKNMTELQETYSKNPDWAARYTKDKDGNLIYA